MLVKLHKQEVAGMLEALVKLMFSRGWAINCVEFQGHTTSGKCLKFQWLGLC